MNVTPANRTSLLGQLEKVEIRDIWKNEASDFSSWLAREENLSLLGDEIGIPISLITTEAGVGSFSADILAEEANTHRKIVIENQLEQSDHDHFGKLFTYGSGLDAEILIWICKSIREEHRQAIDWLNEKTNSTLGIFVIKMEVWRIGNSKPAPKFQVVCSPNDWGKTIKSTLQDGKLSTTNMLQLEFWTEFNSYITQYVWFRPRKPQPQSWYDVALGSSQAHVSLTASFTRNFIRSEFYINDNKDLFHKLEGEKTSIEQELGLSLTWEELPKAKASSILIRKNIPLLKNKENWATCFEWYADIAKKFIDVFPKYI